LAGDVLEAHLSYWRRHLGGDLPLLDLPFARPRPARPSFRGGRCLLDLPGDLSDKLAALNRQHGVTLFMTLLAALEIQLARCTGQESIIVGMTFSNRNQLETEDLIGCFVNTLPLRIDFADVSSFPDLLNQVKEVTLGAFAHQDLPLEKLVEEIRPRRYREGTPLFQMTFGVQNAPREILSFAGIESSPVHGLGVDDAKFDLTIWALETPRGLRIAWTYSRDLFAEEDIVKMHEHFGTLLRSIVREPEAPIDKLEMYSATEKEQFLRQQEIRTEKKRKKLKNIKPQRVKVSE
ncbi:MAG: condensation domain-containing protein, partial [Acidobacteriota bacterium]